MTTESTTAYNPLDAFKVAGVIWRKANPNHCPVLLIAGDGTNTGACWHYLRQGACPQHGQIYTEGG